LVPTTMAVSTVNQKQKTTTAAFKANTRVFDTRHPEDTGSRSSHAQKQYDIVRRCRHSLMIWEKATTQCVHGNIMFLDESTNNNKLSHYKKTQLQHLRPWWIWIHNDIDLANSNKRHGQVCIGKFCWHCR